MKSLRLLLMLVATTIATLAGHAQQTDAFPYPSVPDTLRTPESRATYVMAHYWDRFDFADTTLAHRPEITEQGFANFIDLLPRVAPATAAMGIKAFVDHLYGMSGKTCDTMREYFANITDKYLGDSGSPLHNDLLYAQFLDVMAANKYAGIAERTRNGYMARNLRKNLPGTVAADFTYVDRKGAQHHMHDFNAKYTLLYFYDPDCNHCHDTANQLRMLPSLSANSPCRVLAVYAYDDVERWKSAANGFPAAWTDGYNPEGKITAEDIYYIKSMPSIYLLDSQKRVLLKNPDIKLLQETLQKLK